MVAIKNNMVLGVLLLAFSAPAQDDFLGMFPAPCAEASDRVPLEGHIIRLGFVGWTHYGWSFFFPDRSTQNLQRVSIIDNVGAIGQDPNDHLSEMIRTRTPNGSFVVAQIFVGDSTQEPVVTCLSRVPAPVSQYRQDYYGSDIALWAGPEFGRWLTYRRYSNWNWRRWWGNDFFEDVRRKYRHWKRLDRYKWKRELWKKHRWDRWKKRTDKDRWNKDRWAKDRWKHDLIKKDRDERRKWIPKKIDDRRKWIPKKIDRGDDFRKRLTKEPIRKRNFSKIIRQGSQARRISDITKGRRFTTITTSRRSTGTQGLSQSKFRRKGKKTN